ncbi:hypothetical protein LDENG_00055130 [Lucifuga dentata]|nr:hypothetical protein LDENG_00055130 [Lucifuga dentata]
MTCKHLTNTRKLNFRQVWRMESRHAFSVPDDDDEDSMDIYAGLDTISSSTAGKASPHPSPQLKESMDLYEEILTEEQQSKESTYNELKFRYQAAQNQIRELHKRLEQMELQNTGLNTENSRLKKNICALLRTAKQEVIRKNEEIQRLHERSEKNLDSTPRNPHQPSRERDGVTSEPNSCCTKKRTSNPSSSSSSSSHKDSKCSLKADCKTSDTESSDSTPSSSSASRHGEVDKRPKHRDQRHHKQSEYADSRHRFDSNSNKDSHVPETNRTYRAEKDSRRRSDSRSCKSKGNPDDEVLLRSERTRSPPEARARSRDQRQDKAGLVTSGRSARSSNEGYSRENKKTETGDEHVRKGSGSKGCRLSSKRKGGDSPSRDQRKDERRRGGGDGRDKRSSASERSRKDEKCSSKESDEADISSKEREDQTGVTSERSAERPILTEENSPNRKLCFMETLNLTISPVKKVRLPTDTGQEDPTASKSSEDGSSQLDIEDMCVIDEVDSSDLQDGSDNDDDDDEEKHLLEIPKAHSSDQTHAKSENEKVAQDKSHRENALADGQTEENSVQTTSDPPPAVTGTPQPSETSSLQEKLSSENTGDRTKLASDGKIPECGKPEAPAVLTENHDTERVLAEVNRGNDPEEPVGVAERHGLLSDVETEGAADDVKTPEHLNGKAKTGSQHLSPSVLSQDCQQGPGTFPVSISCREKDRRPQQDDPADADAVSSTISLESVPQEGLTLHEAIYVLTQTNEDAADGGSMASSSTEVSKVSSTTGEIKLPEKSSVPDITPKKRFSPGKCKEDGNAEPSSSLPLLHDEDSMMRTLSGLRSIPDAISPLRSPARSAKRGHLHSHGRPGHVKSLRKDFSSTADEANSIKLDVNKENKYPGSPAKHEPQNLLDKVSDVLSSLSENELEDGEILSENDEGADVSPLPSAKRAKLAQPVRNQTSPKTTPKLSRRKPEEISGMPSPSNKSRFKTVCPTSSKASFSTVEEVMETLKMVRLQFRKKYMKLHKTFPKKSFCGLMGNFQESFLEFVDGAHFGQICSQEGEAKAKLKSLVTSVFSKISDNGIVKRIFEQQAVDLKQKLWDFVDVQVDFMFREINTTLKGFCKAAITQAEGRTARGKEELSSRPRVRKPHLQQKHEQSAAARLKTGDAAAHKTGSRGKDIRINHLDKERNVDSMFPDRQTVLEVLPPRNIPPTPEKSNVSSLVVSQGSSLLDKSDFQILTEQQTSSLTFNLVRDSQMGEIFKCLLQGSDITESGSTAADNPSWSLATPRKDGLSLMSFATPTKFDSPSKLLSPAKFASPSKMISPAKFHTSSKLVTTWSSISPNKMSSPQSKGHVPLNPALFDESCLLEVPLESRMLQTGLASQRSYSILAEDLAMSLTIPSPLKSDSHLSFLQPPGTNATSTPDSVISAHISEDTLLEEEDATEQDIHLALDSDNSSCASSGSMTSQTPATPFHFKPDMPMQAVVLEKSNDHFILKIRQATTMADTTLVDEGLSQTLTEDQNYREESPSKAVSSGTAKIGSSPSRTAEPEKSQSSDQPNTKTEALTANMLKQTSGEEYPDATRSSFSDKLSKSKKRTRLPKTSTNISTTQSSDGFSGKFTDFMFAAAESFSPTQEEQQQQGDAATRENLPETLAAQKVSLNDPRDLAEQTPRLTKHETQTSENVSRSPENDQRRCDVGKKRKKHHNKSQAKRSRKAEEERKTSKSKRKKGEAKSSSAPRSPNNLSAKNVIRKKGEVVLSWTRSESLT